MVQSLCNACGIRQRKARRAALAAANGGLLPSSAQANYKVKKDKRSIDHVDRTLPIKKRCKITTSNKVAPRKITTKDEVIISLSKNSAFHRVFPQDETDAAILLMALSCSLVHSWGLFDPWFDTVFDICYQLFLSFFSIDFFFCQSKTSVLCVVLEVRE